MVGSRFKIYVVKEFQRLKADEQKQIGWSAKRESAKINYHIRTDAIKHNLIPKELSQKQISFVYADEADVLNVALFGKTAKQWRDENPDKKGNIRDFASINELICLSNSENINAVPIGEGVPQSERPEKPNKIAVHQITVLGEAAKNCLNKRKKSRLDNNKAGFLSVLKNLLLSRRSEEHTSELQSP